VIYRAAAAVIAGLLVSGQMCGPHAPGSEEWRTVFADKEWYRARPEPERIWQGTLRRREVIASPNARTALRYALASGSTMIPVYAPLPEDALEPYVGRLVSIRGKVVDLSAEGYGRELWPGSIVAAKSKQAG
jgi:hypothetical protein